MVTTITEQIRAYYDKKLKVGDKVFYRPEKQVGTITEGESLYLLLDDGRRIPFFPSECELLRNFDVKIAIPQNGIAKTMFVTEAVNEEQVFLQIKELLIQSGLIKIKPQRLRYIEEHSEIFAIEKRWSDDKPQNLETAHSDIFLLLEEIERLGTELYKAQDKLEALANQSISQS